MCHLCLEAKATEPICIGPSKHSERSSRRFQLNRRLDASAVWSANTWSCKVQEVWGPIFRWGATKSQSHLFGIYPSKTPNCPDSFNPYSLTVPLSLRPRLFARRGGEVSKTVIYRIKKYSRRSIETNYLIKRIILPRTLFGRAAPHPRTRI